MRAREDEKVEKCRDLVCAVKKTRVIIGANSLKGEE